jgi:hypothetical protein
MANISVQTENKNNFRDLSQSVAILAEGTKLNLIVPENFRVFFEQGVPSLFPKNSSNNYSGGGSVFIDFQTGFITGKDEQSINFAPLIPATGQYLACTAALNRDSELVFFYGNQGLLMQVRNGVLAGSSTYLGDQPLNTIKIFTVIITSSDGVSLSDISNSLIFSYLNSLNINVPASRVSYSALNLNSFFDGLEAPTTNTETIIKEPFLTDVFSGGDQYQTSRTSVKVGDSIVIERWLNNLLQEYPVTVTAVTNGPNNDTVTFSPALTAPHILELRPLARVEVPPVYNLPRALYQKNRRMLFDSGWIPVVLGSNSILSTKEQGWLPDPVSSVPLVVWAATKDSADVVVLSDSSQSDSLRIGVQLTLNGNGLGVFGYSIGTNGVFYNLETSQLVGGGFIRIFLREV